MRSGIVSRTSASVLRKAGPEWDRWLETCSALEDPDVELTAEEFSVFLCQFLRLRRLGVPFDLGFVRKVEAFAASLVGTDADGDRDDADHFIDLEDSDADADDAPSGGPVNPKQGSDGFLEDAIAGSYGGQHNPAMCAAAQRAAREAWDERQAAAEGRAA